MPYGRSGSRSGCLGVLLGGIGLWLAAFVLAWPATAVHAVISGDPNWKQYGAAWLLTACSPVVGLGLAWWYARRRVPVAWLLIRAQALVLGCLATGIWALAKGAPGMMAGPLAGTTVAFLTLLAWLAACRALDAVVNRFWPAGGRLEPRRGRTRGRPERSAVSAKRPQPGQIWWAYVPFEESEGEKHRVCLVLRTYKRHAYVLKITHTDRPEHLPMPSGGWSREPDGSSYLQPDPMIKVQYGRFDEPAGPCPPTIWARVLELHPPEAPPTTERRLTGPAYRDDQVRPGGAGHGHPNSVAAPSSSPATRRTSHRSRSGSVRPRR
jgi:hypothetical protein